MTGLVRKAILFAACGMLAASAAMASTPSAANSTTPNHINLVGSTGGVIDPDVNFSKFTITVRDLNNLPVNNSFVIIDFSSCSGMQLCSDQLQAGITAVCGFQQVRGFTGAGGTLTLAVGGHANNTGSGNPSGDTDPNDGFNNPSVQPGCASIEADGTPLKSGITVASFDHNGGGIIPSDQACYLGDYFGVNSGGTGRELHRSDYDNSGTVIPSDQSIYLFMYFSSNSTDNCGTGGSVPQCAAIP
jgi:hypothetical protein